MCSNTCSSTWKCVITPLSEPENVLDVVELDQKLKKSYQIRIFELPAAQKGAYGTLNYVSCCYSQYSSSVLTAFLQRSYTEVWEV